jgi:hypothetical protein
MLSSQQLAGKSALVPQCTVSIFVDASMLSCPAVYCNVQGSVWSPASYPVLLRNRSAKASHWSQLHWDPGPCPKKKKNATETASVEQQVPPLRCASVGMTNLFRVGRFRPHKFVIPTEEVMGLTAHPRG